jgi:hypothetical protein
MAHASDHRYVQKQSITQRGTYSPVEGCTNGGPTLKLRSCPRLQTCMKRFPLLLCLTCPQFFSEEEHRSRSDYLIVRRELSTEIHPGYTNLIWIWIHPGYLLEVITY